MNIKSIVSRARKRNGSGNSKFTVNLLNALPFWTGALITGIIAVVYARLFLLAESGTAYIFHLNKDLLLIITPACFVISLWLVYAFAPSAKGSGIPQVIASIELSNPKHHYKVNSLLNFRVILMKILSTLVMVFGGGVIGREGPMIQIASSIFKKINDLLPKWYPKISRQNMIVTGAAAGLASAFNTPLGGIVFAIEELTKTHFSFFKSALLTGVIIAGLTALSLSGPYLYLGYPSLSAVPVWLVLIIIPTALVTGVAGSGMGKFILFVFRKKAAFPKFYQKVIYAIVCGLILGALAVFIDLRTLGSGKEIMISTLFTSHKDIEWYIPLLRTIGPVLSFTSETAGGVFAPSLSAGASIGALIGGLFHLSGSSRDLLVLCGMTGFLTGITRSPFTSSILVLEMTNSHTIIFYIMLTALAANLISTLVSRHSFYESLKDNYIREVHASQQQS